jgi:hypothetical protein
VEYAKVEQILAIDVAFKNFTGAGTIGGYGHIVDCTVMSFHNFHIEAVTQGPDLPLIRSVFHSVYADRLKGSDSDGVPSVRDESFL